MFVSEEKRPTFKLRDSIKLYSIEIGACEDFLRFYLSHSREKIINDLHVIIDNSIQNQDIFINEPSEYQTIDENTVANFQFVVHAVYLLGELKSENSLEYFFQILSQSDECLETFIGMDIVNEGIWEPIYHIANHQLDAFRPFLFDNDISFIQRSIFLDVVKQVFWHQPERQEEVKQWYIALLKDFLGQAENGDQPNPEFMGNIIWDILDLQIIEAKALVREAYENDLIAVGICGFMEDVMKDLGTTAPVMKKRSVLDIFERYKKLSQGIPESVETSAPKRKPTSQPSPYKPDAGWLSPDTKPYIKKPETGRNDPCPCGSGKKYKKCCLGKIIL